MTGKEKFINKKIASVIAIVLFGYGTFQFLEEYFEVKNRDVCFNGIILEENIYSESKMTFEYIIGYTNSEDSLIRFKPNVTFTKENNKYNIGDSILVCLNLEQPEKVIAPDIEDSELSGDKLLIVVVFIFFIIVAAFNLIRG